MAVFKPETVEYFRTRMVMMADSKHVGTLALANKVLGIIIWMSLCGCSYSLVPGCYLSKRYRVLHMPVAIADCGVHLEEG